MSESSVESRVFDFLQLYPHPKSRVLGEVLTARTGLSSSGYPFISQSSFRLFLEKVPHLFQAAHILLGWLSAVEGGLSESSLFNEKEIVSVKRAIFVIRNVVFSAAVCAPPDHWILKHILSVHARTGTLKLFQENSFLNRDKLPAELQLDPRHLSWDLSFLYSRGYLRCRGSRYAMSRDTQTMQLFSRVEPVADDLLRDMIDPVVSVLTGNATPAEGELVNRFYEYPPEENPPERWHASRHQVEIGYRLVPTVLALHVLKVTGTAKEATNIIEHFPVTPPPEVLRLLTDCGVIEENRLTILGARVFERAPGPFGIIHAYVPYMRELENKLRGIPAKTHVQRAKNIAASQDANRKTFQQGNQKLDQFCRDHKFSYRVFIEHALGQGEATRQRWKTSGEEAIQYFGADLEDAAIDAAAGLQNAGSLPKNMIFVRRADIANPDAVISAVRANGCDTEDSVMFVGNGFHEIRGQTNEKIIETFRSYCDAGMLLIFTEESALSDLDLLNTGWNTYHAGFRYVHELSGQGLRPAAGVDRFGRFSWKICAALGGYSVLPGYSSHTRTIYPYPKKGGYNPPISMTYFCVPSRLARKLGFYPSFWSKT